MTIKALRLLPTLAFARFGSASEPQANYELETGVSLGFRKISRQPTLRVAEDGKLSIDDPARQPAEANAIFREGMQIRPVAPFFELFAVEEDPYHLVPVTSELLHRYGLAPSDVEWQVHVENRKVFRRTGDVNDKVEATTPWFSDHGRNWLKGTSTNCREPINFGYVQFVKPSPTGAVASHLRLRFTPAAGKIYGPLPQPGSGDPKNEAGDSKDKELSVIPVYTGSTWINFDQENPGKSKEAGDETWPRETLPPSLYANTNELPAAPWLNADRAKSRGYLDDACDGFIFVKIAGLNDQDGQPLQAKARICVGPPAFVPDSQFVRTLADDLDQVVNGSQADDITDIAELRKRALDVVRRAFETVRFMNVALMNGGPVNGRPAEAFDTMPAEEAFATQRPVRPVMAPASVDTAAVLALHQQVFAALSSGAAPWFLRLLRLPHQVGDLTDEGRRKMPALMSGADSFYLALTHRQIDTITKAAAEAQPAPVPRNRTAEALSKQLHHKAAGNPVTSRPEMAIANCCPGLEVDFRAVWRRLFEGIELSEYENYVVKTEGETRDVDGNVIDLKGHRLLCVDGRAVIVTLSGPTPAGQDTTATVRSDRNQEGVLTMEWSNCLSHVIGKPEAMCVFTKNVAEQPRSLETEVVKVRLRVRKFFEPDTTVISEELAEAGELTQGLCSPWQNDLRECSCFYWASSRPDFVNTKIGADGLTHGDYWFARKRTGEYVPDDYVDERLMSYDDLFKNWEKLLQFQIGGQDSAPVPPNTTGNLRREP
jgi:hypothetical protein